MEVSLPVGIGIRNLRYIYEGRPDFAVFPTFAFNYTWGGLPPTEDALPTGRGPLNINAEQFLEVIRPLPPKGKANVSSRIVGVHPRPKGAGFIEMESMVRNEAGDDCVRMVGGSFRRGVEKLGDIEPFEGAGITYSQKLIMPKRPPDFSCEQFIPDNQAHIFRLSGDYNPLHIDPESAKSGGFREPILHGFCTLGHCAHMLLEAICAGDPACFRKIKVRFAAPVLLKDTIRVQAWRDGPGRVLFEADVGGKVVVSNAFFEFSEDSAPVSKL